ncbi:LOW QUALITY PROTEIN: importin-13-like [Amphiura filiformis]|uniref:LOW QUALITY PROTEIN: importin-13-like n=1 Tax=Amphiura filiformis TaxID=82378 RepID=UPI003B20D8CC
MAASQPTGADVLPEITVENIEKAVQQLYYDPNPAVKDSAQRWLLLAQRSPQAWHFAWALLAADKPTEVQYFGASALYTKISRYWGEVHPEQYDMLRTQLFQQIFAYAPSARIVLTRLCVALSSFALNTMPEVWQDAVKGIIDTFQQTDIPQLDATCRCTALLELLTVLPEEFQTTPLAQARKGNVRNELQSGLQHVLPLIQTLLEQHDSPPVIRNHALKCFSSWVQLGVPLLDVDTIISILFQLLRDPALFDLCVDSLISVVNQPVAYKYPQSLRKIITQVLRLQDLLTTAVQEKDMDVVLGICRLAVSLGENHTKTILGATGEERQQAVDFINIILAFTALPGHYPVDETISNMPFGFWYILQDDMVSADAPKFQEYVRIYAPIYMNLVEVMLTKVQYPSDEEYTTWNAEEKEQFRCYRQDIGDTLMYAFSLLREPMLNHLYAILTRVHEQQAPWQHLEACLFAFRSIAEGGDFGDDRCVSNLLQLLPQINMSHGTLASTALYMLGAYSEWLAETPEMLGSAVPLLLSGLSNAELAGPATMSLKDIAMECRADLKPYAECILDASQQAIMSNTLKSRESIRLLSTVGLALATLPLPDIMSYLQLILPSHLETLERAGSEQPQPSTKATVLVKLSMLGNLCASLDLKREEKTEQAEGQVTGSSGGSRLEEPQPVFLILQQVLPIVQKLLNVWISDTTVVEAICEVIKRASRTLLDDLGPLVPQLAELIVQIFNSFPQPSVLELAKQLLVLFVTTEGISDAVAAMFMQLSSKTLSFFPNNAREQTDVVEAYLTLCSQLLKKCSSLFIREECNTTAIFQCSMMAITLPENQTVKASCNFFTDFVRQIEKYPSHSEVVMQNGRALVELVLKAIGGAAPRSLMEPMADVLFILNKHCFTHFSSWITELMINANLELPRVTKEQREQFGKAILRNRVNKRQVRDLVTQFSLMCRGLHGTEYAEY